jgi:hypothetical protein
LNVTVPPAVEEDVNFVTTVSSNFIQTVTFAGNPLIPTFTLVSTRPVFGVTTIAGFAAAEKDAFPVGVAVGGREVEVGGSVGESVGCAVAVSTAIAVDSTDCVGSDAVDSVASGEAESSTTSGDASPTATGVASCARAGNIIVGPIMNAISVSATSKRVCRAFRPIENSSNPPLEKHKNRKHQAPLRCQMRAC